ncbi:hypothetical protein TNCV_4291041 [Trichonephila clavipes]|nr:hypothetical protein TNCV_4291041 [Trichonephila clavipes]
MALQEHPSFKRPICLYFYLSNSSSPRLKLREQFIREQRKDPELGHMYCYLENPDDGSVNVCEGITVNCRSLTSKTSRQGKPPTGGRKHDKTEQYEKALETRTTTSGTKRVPQRRPVRYEQATAVRACPYYLRSRVKKHKGKPEEHWN